jgi:hypothetical protein
MVDAGLVSGSITHFIKLPKNFSQSTITITKISRFSPHDDQVVVAPSNESLLPPEKFPAYPFLVVTHGRPSDFPPYRYGHSRPIETISRNDQEILIRSMPLPLAEEAFKIALSSDSLLSAEHFLLCLRCHGASL